MILVAGNNGIANALVQNQGGYTLIEPAAVESNNISRIAEIIRSVKPSAVMNCREYPFIDEAEYWRGEAYDTNAYFPRGLADICAELGIRLVHLSSSYVFNGSAGRAYNEEDTPEPESFYGDSKLLGEELIQRSGCAYAILRLPDLISERIDMSKNFLFRKKGRSFTCVSGHTVSPVFEKEAASAAAAVCEKNLAGIYHFSQGSVCTVAELITSIIRAVQPDNDHDFQVNDISPLDFEAAAARPIYNVLDNSKFVRHTGFTPEEFGASLSAAALESADFIRATLYSAE